MKSVYCPELDKTYKSATVAAKELGINRSAICNVCSGNRKSTGKHPVTNEKLTWKYINNNKKSIQRKVTKNNKKVTGDNNIMQILLEKIEQMQQNINELNNKVEENNNIIKEQQEKFDKINNNNSLEEIISTTEELSGSNEQEELTNTEVDSGKSDSTVHITQDEVAIEEEQKEITIKNSEVDNSVSIEEDSDTQLKNNIFDSQEDFNKFMEEAEEEFVIVFNNLEDNDPYQASDKPVDEPKEDTTSVQEIPNDKPDLILPSADELGLNDNEPFNEKINNNYNKPKKEKDKKQEEQKKEEIYRPDMNLPDVNDLFNDTSTLFD